LEEKGLSHWVGMASGERVYPGGRRFPLAEGSSWGGTGLDTINSQPLQRMGKEEGSWKRG
jgi:hypothetical protein